MNKNVLIIITIIVTLVGLLSLTRSQTVTPKISSEQGNLPSPTSTTSQLFDVQSASIVKKNGVYTYNFSITNRNYPILNWGIIDITLYKNGEYQTGDDQYLVIDKQTDPFIKGQTKTISVESKTPPSSEIGFSTGVTGFTYAVVQYGPGPIEEHEIEVSKIININP